MNRADQQHELVSHLSPWMLSTLGEQMAALNTLDEIWGDFPSEMLPDMIARHVGSEPNDKFLMRRRNDLAPLIVKAREYLISTATPDEVCIAISLLGKGMKWPPSTIGNPGEHLAIMTRQVNGRYSCAVLFGAMFLLIDEQPWVPAISVVHEACWRLCERIGAMVQLLELPLHEQQCVAYNIEMQVFAPQRMARYLYKDLRQRDRAIAAAYRRANRDH